MTAPIVSTVTLGTATDIGAITVNLTADPLQWTPTYVTLSANYTQTSPAGFPTGVPGQLDGTPNTNRRSYNSGDRVQFWQVEADALVTAGAGEYS